MERLFKLSANQTTVGTEVLAGVTTFLTMAYIIVVQPAVLSGKNVRHGYGPGVWCRHYSDVYFSGAGNRDHGTLRALCDRTGAYPPITAPAKDSAVARAGSAGSLICSRLCSWCISSLC